MPDTDSTDAIVADLAASEMWFSWHGHQCCADCETWRGQEHRDDCLVARAQRHVAARAIAVRQGLTTTLHTP